jgi:hypothetical protein
LSLPFDQEFPSSPHLFVYFVVTKARLFVTFLAKRDFCCMGYGTKTRRLRWLGCP